MKHVWLPTTAFLLIASLVGGWLVSLGYTRLKEDEFARFLNRLVAREAPSVQLQTMSSEEMGAVSLAGALDSRLREAMQHPPTDVASANHGATQALQVLAETIIAKGSMVTTAQGVVAANWHRTGQVAVGSDISAQPYVQAALKGNKNLYGAVNLAKQERSIFVSVPVRDTTAAQSPIKGVAIAEFTVALIDQYLSRWPNVVGLLLTPEGVVFSASRRDWLFRLTNDLSDKQLQSLKLFRHIGPLTDAPNQLARLPLQQGDADVSIEGTTYLVARGTVEWNDPSGPWQLVMLGNADAEIGLAKRMAAGAIASLLLFVLLSLARRVWTDLLARQAAARQLASQVALQQELIDSIPFPVFYKDISTRYLGVNVAYEKAFNAKRSAIVGKRATDLTYLTEADRRLFQEASEALLANPGQQQSEHTMQWADGQWHTLLLAQTCYRDAEGQVGGVIGTLIDVTSLKEANFALAAAKADADKSNQAKGMFLANMSHEIRTPMNAIIGMAHLALETNLTPRQHGYIHKVARAAENLLGIINDILDFSKIDAGRLDLELTDFDLQDLLDAVRVLAEVKAKEKGLSLVIDTAADVPRYLHGDPLRLSQVITNLTNNAIKFSDHGDVAITVKVVTTDEQHTVLHISVADHGIGIAPAYQARLFQSFSQADASTTRKYGGTGLGLAICKRLVELMQGRIWVESELGKGSTFHVHARFGMGHPPLVRDEAATRAGQQTSLDVLAGARLLLVEDNEMNRELAIELLERVGISVVTAFDGQQAIDTLAADADFDGILMDCQMPVLDGYEATRDIRSRLGLGALPIVAMTANALAGDRERALAAGMSDYVTKPIDPANLYGTLARWVRPRQGRHVLPSPSPASPTAVSFQHLAGIDTNAGLAVCSGEPALYTKMLRQFFASQQDFGERFNTARETDPVAALREAHTLKGNAGNIGASELQACAAALEAACQTPAHTEPVQRHLKQTLAALETVMQALRDYVAVHEPDTNSPNQAGKTIDVAQLEALLQTLRQMLQDSDAAAPMVLDKVISLSTQLASDEHLRAARLALDRYDFDAALDLLAQTTFMPMANDRK